MPSTYKVLGQALTEQGTVNVTNKSISSGTVTLTTDVDHKIVVGQFVTVAEGTQTTAVTNAVTASNVTTLTVGPHRINVGQTVTVAMDASPYTGYYDGSHQVTAVTETSISFANTETTLDAAAATGTVSYLDAAFNGTFLVESDPTSTTFTYTTSTADLASTSASNFTATFIPWEVVYTCPANTSTIISSLMLCNQATVQAKYSVAISDSLEMTNANLIFSNDSINSSETIQITGGLIVDETYKYLLVCSDLEYLSVSAFGSEVS